MEAIITLIVLILIAGFFLLVATLVELIRNRSGSARLNEQLNRISTELKSHRQTMLELQSRLDAMPQQPISPAAQPEKIEPETFSAAAAAVKLAAGLESESSQNDPPAEATVPAGRQPLRNHLETDPDDSSGQPEMKAVPADHAPKKTIDWPESGWGTPLTERSSDPTEPSPASEKPVMPVRKVSDFERRAAEAATKIWNWIIVGEEFRPKRVAVEYAVATVWLVRCAVLLLLIGFGFFVKYSHDNNLFPPPLRVAAAVLTGLAIVAFGCKLVKNERYRLIGFGLSGAGTVILYFSIFAAASIYHLLPAMFAFGLMILITVFGALLALRQNSLFVALVAVIGGYATPVLLSTGEKRLPELFAYLLLLGAGSLFLAFHRSWRLLNFVAFALHYLIFFGAMNRFFDADLPADYAVAIGFAGLSFLLFSILPLGYSLAHKLPITLLETLLLLANAGLYFLIGISTTRDALDDSRYAAAVTIFAALVVAVEIAFCFKYRVRDRNLYLSLLTLCSLAVALTVPLLLSDSWITAAWSLQAALMLYLGSRTNSRFLTLLAFLLYLVTGVQAVLLLGSAGNAEATYFQGLLDRFMSLGVYSLSLLAGSYFSKRNRAGAASTVIRDNEPDGLNAVKYPHLEQLFLWAAVIGLLVLFRLEIARMPVFTSTLRVLLCSVLYLAVLGFMLTRDRLAGSRVVRAWMGFGMMAAAFDLARLAVFYRSSLTYPPDAGLRLAGFLVFVLGLGWIARQFHQGRKEKFFTCFFGIAAGIIWFLYSSIELCRALDQFVPHFVYGGLSILWAVYALALLIAGICFRLKALRITALFLFGVVVLKALVIDLSQLPTLYRILAFIPMALLLFFGAFAYMKVEKLFLSQNEPETNHHE